MNLLRTQQAYDGSKLRCVDHILSGIDDRIPIRSFNALQIGSHFGNYGALVRDFKLDWVSQNKG